MNLRLIILTYCILGFSITAFGQYSYTQKLGNLATIALPDTPKIQKANGIDLYIADYKNVIFIAQTGDVHRGLKNIFTTNSIDSVYESYIKGTLTSTNGTLFYKGKIKVNGHDGIEFGYKAKIHGQQTYRYQHAVDLNDTLLMCGIWSSDSLSKNEQHLKTFFDGFKVRSTEQLSGANTEEAWFKAGYAFGIIIVIAIVCLIGLGIVFLIKRLTR
jgi:hypothetical protein